MIEEIPAGKYELNIDAYNELPEDQFKVIEGEKNSEVVIYEGEKTQVYITLEKV